MILKEIGLEAEYWLLDLAGNIVEAPAFNFPADEMGFLVELRSAWGSNPQEIVNTLKASKRQVEEKAAILGFHLTNLPYYEVEEEWQKYIATKYKHSGFEDLTRNIYGVSKHSHHTGLIGNKATAGLHVHFSLFDIDSERYIQMSDELIESIVSEMDTLYGGLIEDVGRVAGEWEPKPYHGGFEYRSLPTNAPHYKVALDSLMILDDLTPELE